MEKGLTLRSNFHLAGVIPVSGHESKFGFPWPDCMQPISDNLSVFARKQPLRVPFGSFVSQHNKSFNDTPRNSVVFGQRLYLLRLCLNFLFPHL